MTKEAMSEAICNALGNAGYKQVKGGANHKAFNKEFIDAIASGVVAEIKANAKANITSGSSAGKYSIT